MVELPPEARAAIDALVDLMLSDPGAPVSVRTRDRALDVHVADSLVGLEFDQLAGAGRIGDLGSGAGFPGLVIAAALATARVDAIESVSRKCDYLRRAIAAAGLANAEVVCERAETWAGATGREAYDAITARAVGSLPTLAELASPLLRDGGHLLAWKGRRDRAEEVALAGASSLLAIEPVEVRWVRPYPGSRDRHVHLLRKNGPTPEGLPRRPGMAAKRPFGPE